MIDVILRPTLLDPARLVHAQVVILDVLRATSTMVTALANGAREVRLFSDIDALKEARSGISGPVVLAGERHCVKIPGFDLGNSPREMETHIIGNATVLMSTTNGTRTAVAAAGAIKLFAGSLLNATATAQALLENLNTMDTLLIAAGTDDGFACEDAIGAGAIIFQLIQQTYRPDLPLTDTAWLCYHAFTAVRPRLNAALRLGQGGINLIEAGLEDDIDFCARIDSLPLVATMLTEPLRVVRQ